MSKALIAMSGGVDSSVAAYLCVKEGYECMGATMKLYSGEDVNIDSENTCCSLDDIEDARNIADKLKEGYIISMSLECVEAKEEVKNIMTFLAGVVYALRADIVSVSDQVWLLYPRNLVQLTEDGKDAQ